MDLAIFTSSQMTRNEIEARF